MDTLLELPTASLDALADEFGTGELQTVAWYADALAQEPFSALVVRLLERPSRLAKFEPETVKDAVISSREPLTAVAFLGSEPSFGPAGIDLIQGFGRDLTTVLSGEVRGRVLLAKSDLGSLLLVVLLVVLVVFAVRALLALLARLFRKRSRA